MAFGSSSRSQERRGPVVTLMMERRANRRARRHNVSGTGAVVRRYGADGSSELLTESEWIREAPNGEPV